MAKRLCFWEGSYGGPLHKTGCMTLAAFLRQQRDPNIVGMERDDVARTQKLRVGQSFVMDYGASGIFRVKRVE